MLCGSSSIYRRAGKPLTGLYCFSDASALANSISVIELNLNSIVEAVKPAIGSDATTAYLNLRQSATHIRFMHLVDP